MASHTAYIPFPILNKPIGFLDIVFSNLTRADDVANARRACTMLATAGRTWMRSTIYVSLFDLDLRQLEVAASHPNLWQNITTLVCDGTTFGSEVSVHPRLREVMDERPFPVTDHADAQRLYQRSRWYYGACKEQHRVRNSGRQENSLIALLPLLHSLSTVIITDRCGPDHTYGFHESGYTSRYHTPTHRSNTWDYHNPLPLTWTDQRCPTDIWMSTTSPLYTGISALKALSVTGRRVKTLLFEGRVTGISHRFFIMDPQPFQHIRNVFQHLTTLEMTIDAGDEDLWENTTLRQGHLRRVLQTAPHLENLQLSLRGLDYNHEDTFDINDGTKFDLDLGLGTFIWRNLRHFSLIGCYLPNHQQVLDFLAAHRTSLNSVKFLYDDLQQGSWKQLFKGMKVYEIQLEECELSCLSDDGGRNMMVELHDLVDFLLGDGPNPANV